MTRGTPAHDWIRAGIMGGALAGLVDAGTAIAFRIGGVGPIAGARLVLLAATVLGLAGGLAGALVSGLSRLLRRRDGAGYRLPPELLVAAAAAPLLIHDARVMFAGPRAARIPAHGAMSIAIVVAGAAAVFAAGRAYRALLVRPPRAAVRRAGGIALVVAGAGLNLASRLILPRLYPWFHATLALVTFVAIVAGARLLVGGERPPRARRLPALAAIAVLGSAVSLFGLSRSQVLRYAAYEKTALASWALAVVPQSLRHRTFAGAEREEAEQSLPPLPEGPRRPDADVLLITIDALRADHVGAYGYPRGITPSIDRLAAEGTRFQRAYSQAPHTSFSVASMLTGKYFPTLARLAPGERHEPIAAVLRTYGWRTAAFYPPAVFYVDAPKLKRYAETHFDFEYVKFEYLDAQRRVDQVLAYYDTVKPKRSFVWIHFFEPHEPYERHAGFAFGDGDIDRYDSEIAYTDAAVGRLVAAVRKRRPGTIIVVSADHGEEFDEHGGRYHGSSLYEEQIRVPLIISVPGLSPRLVGGQVELIDVTPTLLNLLDIPVPARMRGTDLGPWLTSPPPPPERLPPAFAEVEDKRALVWQDEKLLCDLHWGFCAYYDLRDDPRETRNLAEERPDRAARLRGVLDHWLDGHMRLEPLLAKGASNPEGGPVPHALQRGRLGDLLAGPELAALMVSDAPLAQRREAAELLVGLPPRKEVAAELSRAAADPDPVIADWASIGAIRLGQEAARARVQRAVTDAGAAHMMRIRAALALANTSDTTGVPVLAAALDDQCDDVLLCRLVILSLGKLHDRRAVPALLKHIREVQNRREMVDALGDIGDPTACAALIERLRGDEYVPVRVQAAVALAKIEKGIAPASRDPTVAAALMTASRHDTEPTVVAAAREAAIALNSPSR